MEDPLTTLAYALQILNGAIRLINSLRRLRGLLPDSREHMQNTRMRQLSPFEVRFRIKFALQQVPASTIQRMSRHGRDQRDIAVDEIADRIAAAFDKHEVHGPDPIAPHGHPQKSPAKNAGGA